MHTVLTGTAVGLGIFSGNLDGTTALVFARRIVSAKKFEVFRYFQSNIE